jgi:glutathione synthase/RimK-type ligase-like ATP-grasp enzyme
LNPRVMVISTNHWPRSARLPLSLGKIGFNVAAVSPRTSVTRKISGIRAHYDFHSWSASRSIVRAIEDWSPDLLVCSDDWAVDELHQLYVNNRFSKNSSQTVTDLIETSLGDPAGFEIARDKSKFLIFAQSVGVRCPATVVLPTDHFPERELDVGPFPAVLKVDRSFGGRGVRFAYDKHSGRSAFWELQFPTNHPTALKRLYARVIVKLPSRWVPLPRRTVSRQQRIVGRPANIALVCLGGRVLAGICVEAIETLSHCGPATVVRVIDNLEITATAETLVKRLNLSGFVGFDFILDAAGHAWLIEMNPRVTGTSHLCAGDINLSAALWKHLTGSTAGLPASHVKSELPIALFPQELERCPHSPHLAHAYHDVPWDQPEFVEACLRSAMRPHSFKRALDRLLDLEPSPPQQRRPA